MSTYEFLDLFKGRFPEYLPFVKNGFVDKNQLKSIGIYRSTSRGNQNIALGGLDNTVSGELALSILIHWTEDYNACDTTAGDIYINLLGCSNLHLGKRRVSAIQMADGHPVDLGRTDKNVCEMVVRLNIIYDLEEVENED